MVPRGEGGGGSEERGKEVPDKSPELGEGSEKVSTKSVVPAAKSNLLTDTLPSFWFPE